MVTKKEALLIQTIFLKIDDAIERTRSPVPVEISKSKFIREYRKIKEGFLNNDLQLYGV